MEPFLLVHSTGDEQLVPRIQEQLGVELEIVRQDNPLYTKGILATCCVAVASRYHALVSCLGQGVPCIGTGWSHKYRFLFEDYECPEHLLPVDASSKDISACLDAMLDESSRSTLVDRLTRAAARQRDHVRAMWADIDVVLGLRRRSQA